MATPQEPVIWVGFIYQGFRDWWYVVYANVDVNILPLRDIKQKESTWKASSNCKSLTKVFQFQISW